MQTENETSITDKDKQFQLVTWIATHTGWGGNRGVDCTLKHTMNWTNMKQDNFQFVKSCFHCIETESCDIIPKPLRFELRANNHNELPHFDYYYMVDGNIEQYKH